jgi:hypothetical protein
VPDEEVGAVEQCEAGEQSIPAGDDEAHSGKNENLVEKEEHSKPSADDEGSAGSASSFPASPQSSLTAFFANVCASVWLRPPLLDRAAFESLRASGAVRCTPLSRGSTICDVLEHRQVPSADEPP